MKLLGIACALAATGTVLVYGLGLQVQRPIAPLAAKQPAPVTTPKAQAVVAPAPVHAPADTSDTELPPDQEHQDPELVAQVVNSEIAPDLNQPLESIEVLDDSIPVSKPAQGTELMPVEATAEQVFVFWQPFRSRGSAQGFAQGLSARAEVPISVISEDTNTGRRYRVVLPYDSEAQRLERLAKLESATRLEMGE